MAITFFLGVVTQIRLNFSGRKLNSASFASRKLLEKSILKVLGGVHFLFFLHFFMFFQFRAALAPSKITLAKIFRHKNDRNFMVKTMKSSDFSFVENPWRDSVFSKVKKCKSKKVDFGQKMTFFSFLQNSLKHGKLS